MASRLYSLMKYLALTLLILLLLLAAAALWLRWEFQRVRLQDDALQGWYQTEVRAHDDSLPAPQPCARQFPQKKAWFGATHVHTAASYDATSFGSLATADDAYRYGRGAPLPLALADDPPGYEAPVLEITAPLDFMAVTDHSESLGEVRLCLDENSESYGALSCKIYRGDVRLPVADRMQSLVRLASFAIYGMDRSVRVCGEDGGRCRDQSEVGWRENQRATEAWLDRTADCEFTTLHGYEYSLAIDASNLHRNVFFASATVPQAAFSSKDGARPELLWDWLEKVCIDGHEECDAIAIPHNSNWSSGRMWFPLSNQELDDTDRQHLARLRARVEPLAEINQVKGDSECRNGIPSVLGAPDEFCDFEKLRKPSELMEDCGEEMGSGGMMLKGCVSRYSYVRYALTAGLAEQQKLGINPFKFGIIAASDTHNGAPAAGREKDSLGSHGLDRDRQHRLLGEVEVPGDIARGSPVRYSPGGIAGVYAVENSRPALFAAMRARETFGTSGPRIEPRFFAGWDLPMDLCGQSDYLEQAYSGGVPMGGDLGTTGGEEGPVFIASATRDPREGANLLQRIQVIKGWVDGQGRTHQAVYDIAGNAENGASVDPATCEVSGTGFNQLCSSWRDPDFNPNIPAVYYARVLENPSCRWSHQDCIALPENERPETCSDPDLPWQIQERAWTSPIWYPGG